MNAFGLVATMTVLGVALAFGARWRRALRRARLRALAPGAIVIVRTPDRRRLVARVVSRGPSHFWIELPPGDARWWVPSTAVEPASANEIFEAAAFRRPIARAPRRTEGWAATRRRRSLDS
jgi:hypothetical protein